MMTRKSTLDIFQQRGVTSLHRCLTTQPYYSMWLHGYQTTQPFQSMWLHGCQTTQPFYSKWVTWVSEVAWLYGRQKLHGYMSVTLDFLLHGFTWLHWCISHNRCYIMSLLQYVFTTICRCEVICSNNKQ